MNYAIAANQYYRDIREGEYTRARAFVENSGGRDRILKELLGAELIEEDNPKSALKEMREKNYPKSLHPPCSRSLCLWFFEISRL